MYVLPKFLSIIFVFLSVPLTRKNKNSNYEDEKEWMILPNTEFVVEDIRLVDGVTIVDLKQL